MKNYELLCILPGTMTDEEVMAQVEDTKKLIEEKGGTAVTHQDKGKSRLAYPIRLIRYGYFHLIQFQAEPEVIAPLRVLLNINRDLLRSVITVYNPVLRAERDKQFTGRIKTITTFSSIHDRPVQPLGGQSFEVPGMKDKPMVEPTFIKEETEKISEEPVSVVIEEVEAEVEDKKILEPVKEEIKMVDIDKKLDELLEQDLDNI
ncbi:MAG: 30S ribosomal protein S6 [Candidatus Magasanikbacteria bacterium CG_4_10_14_0_2_um_filter_37_12]|uniref:Small ribosomal subunit protein bS6 n=1 Tax=Candidatus Magasanikbacteria bacterium CG_4_10_14_0_2_um_filter_37_12 TaxID=1974637 RepID=A0A2M7V722_9BACT|nr:MAG: 30S ribosomal protein S6 [Candidatus Magasanikbacteria bacterium CG_4_10_14_0_2_um_filter_37_12]